METINQNNLKQTVGPDPVISGASAPVYKKMERITFLRKMYSYPPKVKISTSNTKSSIRNSTQPKILNFNENNLSIENFFHYYKAKKTTSDFYAKQENFIKSNLQNIPVYVILNGNKEIVLAHHPLQDFFLPGTNQSFITEAQNALSPDSVESRSFNSHLGIFFLDLADAEMHLANILKSDSKEASRLGLAIHCVGLDSAYRLMHNHHPGVEFRFLPSLQEVSFFLENNLYNIKNLIDPNVQSVNQGYKTKAYKGVPIYIIRVKDKVGAESLLKKPLVFGSQVFKTVRTTSLYVWRSLTLQNTFFQSPVQIGELHIPSTEKDYKNLVFFKYSDVEAFYNSNKQQIVNLTSDTKNKFFSVFHKPSIYVTNLEYFLENWETSAFFHTNKNQPLGSLFNTKAILFMPPALVDHASPVPERQISAKETFSENLKVKWNILVGVLSDFCSGK